MVENVPINIFSVNVNQINHLKQARTSNSDRVHRSRFKSQELFTFKTYGLNADMFVNNRNNLWESVLL